MAIFSSQLLFAQSGYNRDLWLQKADQFNLDKALKED